MRAKIFIIGLLFAVLCFYSLSHSQVPQIINYQGKLTKPSGALIDTTVSILFFITTQPEPYPYDTVLWSETQSVSVENGIFSVLLGSVNPIPFDVFNGEIRYLGVKVGSDPEMAPRKEMVSVPYAFMSLKGNCWECPNGATYLSDITDNVGIGTTNPFYKLVVADTFFAGTNWGYGIRIAGSQISPHIGPGGGPITEASLKLATFFEGDIIFSTSSSEKMRIVHSFAGGSGNVGIGTADPDPLYKLDVVGNIHASGTIKSGSSITIDGTTDKITATSGTINFDNENLITTGNVGIGTTNPQYKLDVAGHVQMYSPIEPNSYIRFRPGSFPTGSATTIDLNEYRNHNYLGITAYDTAYGNYIYTADPGAMVGQGLGIIGPSWGPFERFVVNTDEVFLGYSIKPGDGTSAGGPNGVGNLYVRGNVGIGTTTPENKLHVNGAINLDPISAPSNPSAGFVIYVDSADNKLKAKSSSGTVTVLANP